MWKILITMLIVFHSSSVQAGPLSDKLFEFTDSAIENAKLVKDATTKVADKAQKKVSNSYYDYRKRKNNKKENEMAEKARTEKAVNYYEEMREKQDQNKNEMLVTYSDPCRNSQAFCETDKSGRKWCWFPGMSKSLCNQPPQVVKKAHKSSKITLKMSLKKKRDECRKKVYDEWTQNDDGVKEFSSTMLFESLKVCD